MNDCRSVCIGNDADFKRLSRPRRSNEHRYSGIVGFECFPMLSKRMQHVSLRHIVSLGAPLDVHFTMLYHTPGYRQHLLTIPAYATQVLISRPGSVAAMPTGPRTPE